MAFVFWSLIGAAVSVVARFVSPGSGSAKVAVPVGVAGAVSLGVAACLLVGPPRDAGLSLGSILVAVFGASIFLYVSFLVTQKTS